MKLRRNRSAVTPSTEISISWTCGSREPRRRAGGASKRQAAVRHRGQQEERDRHLAEPPGPRAVEAADRRDAAGRERRHRVADRDERRGRRRRSAASASAAGQAGIDRRDRPQRAQDAPARLLDRAAAAGSRAGSAPAWPISKPPRLSGARMAKAVTSTMSPPIQPTSARQRCSGSAESCGRSKSVAPVVVRQDEHLEIAAAEAEAGHQRDERRRQHQRQEQVARAAASAGGSAPACRGRRFIVARPRMTPSRAKKSAW